MADPILLTNDPFDFIATAPINNYIILSIVLTFEACFIWNDMLWSNIYWQSMPAAV